MIETLLMPSDFESIPDVAYLDFFEWIRCRRWVSSQRGSLIATTSLYRPSAPQHHRML